MVSFTDTMRRATPAGAGSDTVSIDTANPSVTASMFGVGDATLSDGDTQLAGDLHVLGGTGEALPGVDVHARPLRTGACSLSLIWNADNTAATATFTAEDGFAGTGSVSVAAVQRTERGNRRPAPAPTAVQIDTAEPERQRCVRRCRCHAQRRRPAARLVTFTFSEAVALPEPVERLGRGARKPVGADLERRDNTQATATFTAEDGFAGTGSVSVASAATPTRRGNRRPAPAPTRSASTRRTRAYQRCVGVGDATLSDGDPQLAW